MKIFTISGFADEIDASADKQIEEVRKLAMEYIEVRGVDGKNVSELTEEEVEAFKLKLDKGCIKVSSIGSPIGKIKITDNFEEHLEKLEWVIKIAKTLETKYIRVFSFYIDKGDSLDAWRDEVISRMKKMAEVAEREGIVLLHENEKDIYGEAPERCLDILKAVNSPALRACFDPANFVQAGFDPYNEAYPILKDYIEYMHIKDAKRDGTITPAGLGEGGIENILVDLMKSGWKGFLSLEPHLGSFVGLDAIEGESKTATEGLSTPEKFKLAHDTLKAMVRKHTARVRFGMIGLGNMGSIHVRNFVAGYVHEGVLTAVCDIDEGKRDAFKKNYPDIPVFADAEELYESGLVDVVVIAVPHYDHPRLAISAFEHGLSVITEKPAGVYTKQVLEMNEASKKAEGMFGIMYNQRSTPVYQKLKEMIDSGELGRIKRVQWTITNWYRSQAYHDSASWRSCWATEGGGALINQNPHQLDLWQWLFGMPKRIMSHTYFGKFRNIEVEDEVTAFMEYENGMTGVYITSTTETPGTNRLEIASDMGRVIVEGNTIRFDKLEESEPE
ncbi:MAG: TIM barrel protein, partial [Clostridia bacterium]|nr:TIM barrel protein [Clostridia bacterium]